MATQRPKGSESRRILAKIEAVLSGKVDKDVQQYAINGRMLTKIPIPELLKLKAVYTQKMLNEDRSRNPFGGVTFR